MTLGHLFGLGTPVIEPGRPIDPERPKDETPSFISARINILPWRVVTNDAVLLKPLLKEHNSHWGVKFSKLFPSLGAKLGWDKSVFYKNKSNKERRR